MNRWSIGFAAKDAAGAPGLSFADGIVTATLTFTLPSAPASLARRMEAPLVLSARAAEEERIVLSCDGHRLALYAGGVLADEEWPIGTTALPDALREVPGFAVSDEPFPEPPFEPRTVRGLAGFRPAPGANIGDCMPFADGGLFRLYYLYDRRHHHSKWGLGAHQWGQITSPDLVHWTTQPLAVPVTDAAEGSICTGSVMRCGDRWHAFFAIRACDGSPAQLTSAVSSDGVHFEKTGRVFTLPEPYDAPSARDPKVFRDGDGFTMLVTTSYRGRGCLAALRSDDLETWTLGEPALLLDEPTQPECPDCFTFAGHTYLVYGLHLATHYRIFDPETASWRAPRGDGVIAGGRLSVPKAAVFGGRLIFAGWRADPPESVWGGGIELYEGFASSDGTLTFAEVRA